MGGSTGGGGAHGMALLPRALASVTLPAPPLPRRKSYFLKCPLVYLWPMAMKFFWKMNVAFYSLRYSMY